LNEQTSYSYTGVSPHLGYAITHDLKCKEQGRMIQVSIPASAGAKNFEYNAEVELINPTADTVATATFQGVDVGWYIKAEDIVLKKSQNNAQWNQSRIKIKNNVIFKIRIRYDIIICKLT